jgi:hypothetical protein
MPVQTSWMTMMKFDSELRDGVGSILTPQGMIWISSCDWEEKYIQSSLIKKTRFKYFSAHSEAKSHLVPD